MLSCSQDIVLQIGLSFQQIQARAGKFQGLVKGEWCFRKPNQNLEILLLTKFVILLKIRLSRTFDMHDSNEMGRQFFTRDLLLALNTGIILLIFHSIGVECCNQIHSSMNTLPYQQLRPGILTPYTKKGVELLSFFLILLGQRTKYVCSQQSSANFQYGQTVKSHFAVLSSGQTVKVTVKIS